jgi:hypothetical protein
VDTSGQPITHDPEADYRQRSNLEVAVRAGTLLYAELDQDDDFLARFRLGPPTPAEDEEWICRMAGPLDLSKGRFWCNRAVVEVPPGQYLADVRCYVPYSTAYYVLNHVVKRDRDRGDLHGYWNRTRKKETVPRWLAWHLLSRLDEPDEELEARLEADQPPGGAFEEDDGYVQFLVALTPLQGKQAVPALGRSSFFGDKIPRARGNVKDDAMYTFVWECRKPTVCPRGILAGTILDPGL